MDTICLKKACDEFDNVFYQNLFGFSFLKNEYSYKLCQNLQSLMGERFLEYNFYIFTSNWGRLPNSIHHETNRKKILLYLGDESGEVPYHLSSYYHMIFKQYLPTDKFAVNNIFNFVLGSLAPEQPYKNMGERKHSVFFSGALTGTRLSLYLYLAFGVIVPDFIRRCFAQLIRFPLLLKLFTLRRFDSKIPNAYIRFTNGFSQGLPREEYSKILADSKIVLCPRGAVQPECFRHGEAMRAGCVMISQRLPLIWFYRD